VVKTRLRDTCLILAILATAVYVNAFRPKAIDAGEVRLTEFPEQIRGWTMVADGRFPEEIVRELDHPTSIIRREYANGKGERIDLVVIYHINNRWGAHDPHVCYRSQGWSLAEDTTIMLSVPEEPTGNHLIKKLFVSKGETRKVVLFWWYGSGQKQVESRFKQMLAATASGLFHGRNQTGFITIDATVQSQGNEERVLSTLLDFAGEVSAILPDYLP